MPTLIGNKFDRTNYFCGESFYKDTSYKDHFTLFGYTPSPPQEPIEIENSGSDMFYEMHHKNRKNLAPFSIEIFSEMEEDSLFAEQEEIRLEVRNKQYTLPKALKAIADQVEEAKEILDYSFDWNEEGALPTDEETFAKAASFTIEYALWIYENYEEIIATPYIDIMKNGAVSVHWENDEAQLLIIFNRAEDFKREEEKLAYFYAERKENKIPFKSAVKPNAAVDEFIGLWMKKNLT